MPWVFSTEFTVILQLSNCAAKIYEASEMQNFTATWKVSFVHKGHDPQALKDLS